MRILVLSWRDPGHPLAGGAEQVVWEHVLGWIKAGHRVTWFGSSFDGAKADEVRNGVNIVRRGNQILGVQIAAFFWYVLGKERFDLVVDQFHGVPFFTPIYVRVPKLAIIQEVARNVWMRNDLPRPWNVILGALGYVGEPTAFWFYRNVQFMTGSRSACNDVVKMGIKRENIAVVPHGVIIDAPKKLPSKEKVPTIVFLGALARDKGIETAIKVFSILAKNESHNYWVVGKGGGPYLKYLENLVKEHKISGVKFWGFVDQKKKFELLARAWVLVNPSMHEGWGLVNIEANAMGTPVVAHSVAGLVDSVSDARSGLLCKENTPEQMADKVVKLLDDRVGYRKICKSAISWSKKFSWKRSAEMSLQLINRVAKQV